MKFTSKWRRLTCLVTSICMLVTMVPAGVLAEELPEQFPAEIVMPEAVAAPVIEEVIAEEVEVVVEEAEIILPEETAPVEEPVIEVPAVEEEPAVVPEAPVEEVVVAPAPVAPVVVVNERDSFEAGYVTVKAGTTVYAAAFQADVLGAFAEDGVAYAKRIAAVPSEEDWLQIAFAAEEVTVGYVQMKDVTVVDADEAAVIAASAGVQDEEGNVLPEVVFAAAEELPELLDATAALAVSAQPVDYVGEIGSMAMFTVKVTGGTAPYTYQWEYRKSPTASFAATTTLSGAKTATLAAEFTTARKTYEFRCRITDATGAAVTTDAVKMVEGSAAVLAVTAQPEDYVGAIGSMATFTVAVEGGTAPYTYQWEFRKSATASFAATTTLSGAKTATLAAEFTTARKTYEFRCRITDATGAVVTTDAVKMIESTVAPLTVATQPEDFTGAIGSMVKFTAAAEGGVAPYTYQWEFRKSANGAFAETKTLTGATTDTLTVEFTLARKTYEFRCKITDATGAVVTTDPVKMIEGSLVEELEIVEQSADYVGAIGTKAQFSVAVKGGVAPYTYQWMFRKSATGTFAATTTLTGAKTDTLTVEFTTARKTYEFCCKITDAEGTVVISDAVKMVEPVVEEELEIAVQPEDYEGAIGTKAQFTVAAQGGVAPYTYQWMFRKSATGTFAETKTLTGATTDTLTVEFTTARKTYEFCCKITDAEGTVVITDAVKMVEPIVAEELEVAVQPEDYEGAIGTMAQFTVAAKGGVAPYTSQWMFRKSATGTFADTTTRTGATTDTLTVEFTTARKTYAFRCKITDADGTVVYSDVVTMAMPGDIEIDEVVYSVKDDGTVFVKAYNGSASSLVIPETVEGMTVNEIGESAFEGKTCLVSIDLPDTIQVIRRRAFANCSNLSSMN